MLTREGRTTITGRTEILSPPMFLVVVAGPPMEPVELVPTPRGTTIGRHGDCDVVMPVDADRVSRFHTRIDWREGVWAITDLKSRWGTTVNGVRLPPDQPVPLNEGDLILVAPFTFAFSATPKRRGMMATPDFGKTVVRTIGGAAAASTGDAQLQLLLNSAEQLHAANDVHQLAERLIAAALRGSGLTNGMVLRPTGGDAQFEIYASSFAGGTPDETPRFSRSLIAAASNGEAAELIGGSGGGHIADVGQSIVQIGIGSALCVPLTLGAGEGLQPTIFAYLYLDSRGLMANTMRPQAREFCVALGRMASLSLANHQRLDIERRQARLEAELKSAAKMQAWMLPQRHTTIGPLKCIGESRFGQAMGGDFFDLIDLGDDKVAVTIGDVSGKGVAASVIMTATQGYLHAALRDGRCPKRAVEAAHAFVAPRRPIGKFVTVWVGVIDLKARTIKYIDAGHGYALLQSADGTCASLAAAGGPPIGMIDDVLEYELAEVAFPAGSNLLLMSDGIIEQFGLVTAADGSISREQFEIAGAIRCLEQNVGTEDIVNCLFGSLIKHAGTDQLSDDATIVWVKG